MADFGLPKINTAFIFYTSLVSQADTKVFKSVPTLAAGDFKISIDGGAFANLATLPTNTPGTFGVKVSLSAGEMNGANILVVAHDAAGAEWCDQCWNIQTSTIGMAEMATFITEMDYAIGQLYTLQMPALQGLCYEISQVTNEIGVTAAQKLRLERTSE